MKRFTPYARKPARRRLLVLAAWAILLSLITWHAVRSNRNPPPAPTMSSNGVMNVGNIHMYYTGRSWAGEPVYQLTNDGTIALRRVNVFSWSESVLPILYIGEQLPSDIDLLRSLPTPSYTLPPHQSLWFVGPSSAQANTFVVMWEADGHAEYVNLKVLSRSE